MSLYGQYIKEREDMEIIEDDRGFLTYKAYPTEYRIFDLYVSPDFRKSGHASHMADQVASIALENGCKILTGSVDTRIPSATTSTLVLLAYGFKILRTDGFMLHFMKEI